MKEQSKINILIDKIIQDDFHDYPEDESDEFSEFEMRLKRFCFDNNRDIVMQIDETDFRLELYHDVLDALEDELCEKILRLQSGSQEYITFGSYLYFNLKPDKERNSLTAELLIITTGESHLYTFCLSNFSEKINLFINAILNLAVQQGYICKEDVKESLRWPL
jgi:hypothetical protein